MAVSPIRFNRRHVKAAITFKQLPAETSAIHHPGWPINISSRRNRHPDAWAFHFLLSRPPSFPTGSFLLHTHAEVRQAGAAGAPITAEGWGRGEAGLKPKAGDQMWALPGADYFA